jgi:hypothetical protein
MNLMRPFNRLCLAAAFAAAAASSAPAQPANAANRPDYSAFKIVADRNIFDPNRYPHTPGRHETHRQTKTADAFALVGVMSYQKGAFAFFDGSSSDYRKVLKPTDTIAGFTLVEIAPDKVRLTSGTNQFVLPVGAQLRREEDEWVLNTTAEPVSSSGQTEAGAATSGDDSSAPPPSSGAASDILKRLMQRREQELNR